MCSAVSDPQKQFHAVDALLTRWLKERRQLLGRYTELAVTLDTQIDTQVLKKKQQVLCELLVDYVSAGHFEVYHELIEEAESFGDGSSAIARELIPSIGDTTEVILAYEEKYAGDCGQTEGIRRDLSALGEMLESRFVLEDQLIAGLHARHRRQVEHLAPADR
jgi:regulator of sigma D